MEMAPRSAVAEEAEAIRRRAGHLQRDGWLELGQIPEWDVFELVESYHTKYCQIIINILERERSRWFEDVTEKGVRPGSVVAGEISWHLEPEGLWVSAVHPSESGDEETDYEATGPRFYVSLVAAAMRRGPAPRPPEQVADLLWPNEKDRKKPWITELGWTVVPPSSDAQAMHADITHWDSEEHDPREYSCGRFHHFIWKADRTSNCTTGVVTAAFTNGRIQDWMYDKLHRVSSPTVVLDSEVCHCGGPTGPEAWTSSCTVQLCSSTGWPALQERAVAKLLAYVLPIDFGCTSPWVEVPLESQMKPCRSVEDVENDFLKRGGKKKWKVGALVEACFGEQWYLATVTKRSSKRTYSVTWQDRSGVSVDMPISSLRARRWPLGPAEVQWHNYDWCPAEVTKVRNSWTYRVHWNGGTCTHFVDHWGIRPLATAAANKNKKRSRSETSTTSTEASSTDSKHHKTF